MGIICIAVLLKNDKKVGYRLYDKQSNFTKDIPFESIVKGLANGVEVENIKLTDKGEVEFTAGSEDRYAKAAVDYNEIVNKPLVVLAKSEDKTKFKVINYKGIVKTISNEELLKYGKRFGLANAKIVSKDGKEFISAINNSFDTEEDVSSKRFVMLFYKGKKSYIGDAVNYSCYDIITNKILSRREMEDFRVRHGDRVITESIIVENGKLVHANKDIFPIVFSKTVYTGNDGLSWGSTIIVRHYIKNNEVKFIGINLSGSRIREFTLYEILNAVENKVDGIVVRCGKLNNGKLAIITGSTIYQCDEAVLEEAKQKFAAINKVNARLSLIGDESLNINNLGVLVSINNNKLDNQKQPTLIIPSQVKMIRPSVIFTNGNEKMELKIPSTVKKLEYTNGIRGFGFSWGVNWKKVICESEGVINQIASGNSVMSTIMRLTKYTKNSYYRRTGDFETNVALTPKQYICLTGWFGNIKCSNSIDWDAVADIISKEVSKKCKKVVEAIQKDLNSYGLYMSDKELYRISMKVQSVKMYSGRSNVNIWSDITSNYWGKLNACGVVSSYNKAVEIYQTLEDLVKALEVMRDQYKVQNIGIGVELEKQINKVIEVEDSCQKIICKYVADFSISVVSTGVAQYIIKRYNNGSDYKEYIGTWFKVRDNRNNVYWALGKNFDGNSYPSTKAEKGLLIYEDSLRFHKLTELGYNEVVNITEKEYEQLLDEGENY